MAKSVVDRQLLIEAQPSSRPINGEFLIDSPCLDITASVDDEPPTKKRKIFDAEKIIIGEELSDVEINYAQRLLKDKHPNVGGLRTTLYK